MLMPDVTEIIDDPEIGGGQPFDVVRQIRHRTLAAGKNEQVINKWLHATGNIQPAGEDALQLMPEEDRSSKTIVIRAKFAFQLGNDNASSYTPADIVIYIGEVYKVTRLEDWSSWGFQTAYATLQKGCDVHDYDQAENPCP